MPPLAYTTAFRGEAITDAELGADPRTIHDQHIGCPAEVVVVLIGAVPRTTRETRRR
jgi:hypothetical protein